MIISFEGADGCGKSTQARLLSEKLAEEGIPSVLVREPGGTGIGEKIRSILLDRENTNISLLTETYLFAASRAQVIEEVIKPALAQGKVVICDRFYDSSVVYQGRVNGLTEEVVWSIHKAAVKDFLPNLCFLLTVSPETTKKRCVGKQFDRIELKGPEYQKKVECCYKERAEAYPCSWFTLDGEREISDLSQDIWNIYKYF